MSSFRAVSRLRRLLRVPRPRLIFLLMLLVSGVSALQSLIVVFGNGEIRLESALCT
jgi:hypothetical protein